MVATPPSIVKSPLVIKWEKLPDDVPLEEEPVENEGHPLLAGALRESLELTGFIQPEMLIASNLSGAENLGESHPEIVVTRENSIRKSNISRLAIEAQAGGGLLLGKISN